MLPPWQECWDPSAMTMLPYYGHYTYEWNVGYTPGVPQSDDAHPGYNPREGISMGQRRLARIKG